VKILAIETSCDETAISILDIKGGFSNTKVEILSDKVLSQIKIHAEYGGVFPALAKREHAKNLLPILKTTLKQANLLKVDLKKQTTDNKTKAKIEKLLERETELLKHFSKFITSTKIPKIDAIAVTYGPGLAPALWVGLNFAKALSIAWDKPLIPVNHMEGHILAALLDYKKGINKYTLKKIKFPSIALLISGGHTEIVLMTQKKDALGWKYKVLGQTRDDAVGEAFDKVARMLGLPYPGGPEISRLAKLGKENPKYKLPRPMMHSGDLDFSFSGLKTAVLYMVKKIPKLTSQIKADIAREFEEASSEILIKKTLEASQKYKAQTIIIGGGVSANNRIKEYFREEIKRQEMEVEFLTPSPKLSTDNALMIGLSGYFRALKKEYAKNPNNLKADGNLRLS